jgi:hypothetical protein
MLNVPDLDLVILLLSVAKSVTLDEYFLLSDFVEL